MDQLLQSIATSLSGASQSIFLSSTLKHVYDIIFMTRQKREEKLNSIDAIRGSKDIREQCRTRCAGRRRRGRRHRGRRGHRSRRGRPHLSCSFENIRTSRAAEHAFPPPTYLLAAEHVRITHSFETFWTSQVMLTKGSTCIVE